MQEPGTQAWDKLVGDLYESVLDPDAAMQLPGALARITGAGSAALWCLDPQTGALAGPMLTNLPAEGMALYAAHYHTLDPWTAPLARSGLHGAVVRGSSLIEDAALTRSTYYGEFGAAFDTFHVMGAVLPLGIGAAVGAVALQRPHGSGGFEDAELARLTRLLPHVRRALQLRAQLAATAVTACTAALEAAIEALGTAAAVLDGHGRMLRANTAAERLDRAKIGLRLNGDLDHGVAAAHPSETRRLREAVADAARGGSGGALRLTLHPNKALLAVVAPLPRSLAVLAGAPHGLVLLTMRSLDRGGNDDMHRLGMRILGFTAAEAEVAAALSTGMSPGEIAKARNTRISTIRTLLARAQGKAGARNLRDLVGILTALQA